MADYVDYNLDQLALAYDVTPPSIEGVADEIVGHASGPAQGEALTWGDDDYAAVVDILLAVVETPDIVQALGAGDPVPEVFIVEVEGRVWPEGRRPSISALAMVELVISDIRRAFRAKGE
jgi:hypothetical protein